MWRKILEVYSVFKLSNDAAFQIPSTAQGGVVLNL
jgi:hypothetical protein